MQLTLGCPASGCGLSMFQCQKREDEMTEKALLQVVGFTFLLGWA